MAAPGARIRAWRSAFGALRRGSCEPAAVQELLAVPGLARSAHEFPAQEVVGDILFLLDVVFKFPYDSEIASICNRVCHLLADVISSLQLEFRAASAPQVSIFLRGLVERNRASNQNQNNSEALNAIGYFVHGSGQHLPSEEANFLLLSLVPLMRFQRSVQKDRRGKKGNGYDSSAFVAVANIFTRCGASINKITWETVVQAFRKVLDEIGTQLLEDSTASRYYATVLRSLHLVLSDAKGPLDDNVGGFVAILRIFIAYGLSGGRLRNPSDGTTPTSAVSQPAPRELSKNKSSSLYRPPHLRNRQDSADAIGSTVDESEKRMLFSDSEQSDNDGSLESDHFRSSKARTNAILCIQAIARADPKSLYAHWSLLLPTHNVLHHRLYQPTLLTTLLFDPVSKTRGAAAGAVSALLEGSSRTFLHVAEFKDSGKAGSFTTLSTSLGQMIVQLYKGLLHSVSNESHGGVVGTVLKAVSLLVSSSPIDRLPAGLLYDVVTTVHRKIHELSSASDQTLVVSGLSCLSSALSVSSGSSEILNLLLEQLPEATSSCKKFIFSDLVSLAKTSPSLTVRIEALQALKAAVHSHSALPSVYWNVISDLVQEILEHENASGFAEAPNSEISNLVGKVGDDKAVYHALKLLDESLRVISGFKGADDMFDIPTSSPSPSLLPQPVKLLSIPERELNHLNLDCADTQWLEAMKIFLPQSLEHPSPMVRAAALTCFAGLTPVVYSNFSEAYQDYILSVVINAAVKDETPSVRSAACRALGVLVGCNEIVDRAERIKSAVATVYATISDGALSVRITSCWALANICDAFCKNSEKESPVCTRDPELLNTLADIALKAARDGDKVRANAVRALGNLAKFVDFSETGTAAPCSWLGRMVQTLVSCITTGNVKVQWNVCHALGNLFLNKTIRLSAMTWSSSVFSILLLLLRDSGNFKIRIHAASALAVPSSREDFGDSYGDVLHGLVHALESLNSEGTGPTSFKYIPTLSDQLTSTCLQVLSYASSEDYSALKDFLHKRAGFLHGWLHSILNSAPRFEEVQNAEAASANQKQAAARQAVRVLSSLFEHGGDRSLQEKFQSIVCS